MNYVYSTFINHSVASYFLLRVRNASIGIAPCGKLLRNPRGFIRSQSYETQGASHSNSIMKYL